jgi:5-methylcytosine-specific restriction endonuclease McrA
MQSYAFAHLSDGAAWSSYEAAESREIADTAVTLALLSEVDERKLYLQAGYSSMADYCVRRRGMTDDMAWLRIRVARNGRLFPAIFPALAEGRLNLTSVLLLAPKLTPENAQELVAAAAGKTKEELKLLLVERFPQPVEAMPQLGLDPVGTVEISESAVPMEPLPARAKIEPVAAERYTLQCTIDKETRELLRYAQSLLGHAAPKSDVGNVLKRSLRALVGELERQKFGKCSRPGKRRGSSNPRYIPLEVKRAVLERDGGQCAFVGTGGTRCESRELLEFDHQEAVGRGGRATVENIRLLCRAHNQYAAEQTYGKDFMHGKREQARERAEQAKAKREAKAQAKAAAKAAKERAEDIIPYLRELGYPLHRARRGVELTMQMLDAPIEERMKVALRGLAPKCLKISPQGASAPA